MPNGTGIRPCRGLPPSVPAAPLLGLCLHLSHTHIVKGTLECPCPKAVEFTDLGEVPMANLASMLSQWEWVREDRGKNYVLWRL